jgi:tetratricopeptide (TPR) repeat protein
MRKPLAVGLLVLMTVPALRSLSQSPDRLGPAAGIAAEEGILLGPVDNSRLQQDLQHRNYKDAEQMLINEINRDPLSSRARGLLVLLGHIFFQDGGYLNAAIAWTKADHLAPLDDSSRFTLAMADVELHRPDWARAQLRKLAAANPKVALYPYWLGRLAYDRQQYSSAIRHLTIAIQLDPDMARAYDRLGLCYDYLGHTDRAVPLFKKAVALNRDQRHPSPWPNLDLAIALMRQSKFVEAEAQLREALSYDATLPQANYRLGLVLGEQGRLNEAIISLQRAATLDPAYPEPHYALARFYKRLGQVSQAKKQTEILKALRRSASPLPASQSR